MVSQEKLSVPPKLSQNSLNGDPRAFTSGFDTAVPAPPNKGKDTGVLHVTGGDPRRGWLTSESKDPLLEQEELDIRRALTASLKDLEAKKAQNS